MADFLLTAGGNIGAFEWSFTMKAVGSSSEAATETAWGGGIAAMFGLTAFKALLGATTELTYTSTSTADASWKQTTKTETSHAITGTGTGSLPFQTCAVVTWRTASATKWGHGRWYLPSFAPAALDPATSVWSAATLATMVTAVEAATTAWSGVFTPVILHRRGTISGPGALTTTNITKGDVSNKPAVQRRRGDKYTVVRANFTL